MPVAKEHNPKRLRVWALRLACVILTPLVTLVGLECVFRVFGLPPDPPVPAESYENAAAVDDHRNRLGLRERWEDFPDDADAMRIAFLGDSITFGAGVEQEDCFVHQVELQLNASNSRRFVTFNMGLPGTDPTQQLDFYLRTRQALQPQLLIHVLYPNDLGHDLYDDLKRIHAMQNRRSIWAQEWRVWRLFEERRRSHEVRQRTLDYFRGGSSPFQREQAWTGLKAAVQAIEDAAAQDHTVYAIVMFPWLYALEDYPLADVHQGVRQMASTWKIPFLDLLDAFKPYDARSLRISVIDEHPATAGHTIAAQAITKWLREAGLLVPQQP